MQHVIDRITCDDFIKYRKIEIVDKILGGFKGVDNILIGKFRKFPFPSHMDDPNNYELLLNNGTFNGTQNEFNEFKIFCDNLRNEYKGLHGHSSISESFIQRYLDTKSNGDWKLITVVPLLVTIQDGGNIIRGYDYYWSKS